MKSQEIIRLKLTSLHGSDSDYWSGYIAGLKWGLSKTEMEIQEHIGNVKDSASVYWLGWRAALKWILKKEV